MNSFNNLPRIALALLLAGGLALAPSRVLAHDERESRAESGGDRDRDQDRDRDRDRESSGSNSHGGESRDGDSADRSGPSGDAGKSSDDLRESERKGGDGGSGSDGKAGNPRDSKGRGRDSGARVGRSHHIDVERDSHGHERLRAELLVAASPRELSRVSGAGFAIIEQEPLSTDERILARVRVRPGESVERAQRELQALLPDASVAPHHLFRPAAGLAQSELAPRPTEPRADSDAELLGVIDTGIAPATRELEAALVHTEAFAPGGYVPRTHGTVVGAVAARAGARLSSADVFGVDSKNQLAAPTAAIVRAIDRLVSRGVRVLNISIEGPDNLILRHEIRRALARGVMIVAAAGNDGPSAAPAFPAAYPGVVAVTAVDETGRVYRRANRGTYVAFAARGVNVASPLPAPSPASFSGTSFAAPLVASLLLQRRLTYPDESDAEVLLALRLTSRDLGAPGRDEIFGWGELTAPPDLHADFR